MFDKIEEIKKAKSQIVEGSLTIWNARLDALNRAGDMKGALDQLVSPIEAGIFDNCGCNSPCGAGLDRILPEELARFKTK
jgi:hypothetical protein